MNRELVESGRPEDDLIMPQEAQNLRGTAAEMRC